MTALRRVIGLTIGLLALCFAGAAPAQENLDSGKSAAQLFASDCVICHKTPKGLAKSGGFSGLEGFLREHYTASRESAAAIATYLRAAGPAPVERARATKRTGKGDEKAKSGAKKPAAGKSGGEAKPAEAKPSDAKPSEAKPSETKPAESKPAEAKPAEAKPADAKPSAPKASEGGKSD